MRILLTTPAYYPSLFGGVKNYVTTLSRELVKAGNEVTVYTSNAYDYNKNLELRGKHYVEGVRVIYLNNYFPKKYWHTPGVIMQITKDKKKFDIIHLNNNFNYKNMIVFLFAFIYRIPVVFSSHGSLTIRFQNYLMKWIYNTAITRSILRYSSKLIALNPEEEKQLISLGANPKKIEQIPLGINLNEFQKPQDNLNIRDKYNIFGDEKIILFVGRLHYIKGIKYAVRAVKKLVDDGQRVRFIVAGPDFGELESLKELTSQLGIEEYVIFTGLVEGEEKIQLFFESDIFLLPSISDMFPTVVLEAGYCGLPLILSEGVLLSELIKKESAKIVQLDDDSIAATIKMLINDEKERMELSDRARNIIIKHYSSEAICKRILELYKSVID